MLPDIAQAPIRRANFARLVYGVVCESYTDGNDQLFQNTEQNRARYVAAVGTDGNNQK